MNDWFEIWFEDKECILETMRRNMKADLDAGYEPNGHCIRKQVVDIEEYEMKFDREVEMLKMMDEKATKHWCYLDLKKRGAI